MSYTALYRKFRPITFEEIVGQEHITKTLRNQILSDRIGHAYLFNGGRGTGKTSVAKIMSRALNCLNPQNAEPCNECEICKAALSGSLTDIVEMDAASNNSVEDIRAIRDEVNFLPTIAKYRVYIIDEVHMLSIGAFNALLKTLEEPPAHVKFILATTEPQKLPATILSRCQRFDFKRISTEDIITRLKIICNKSKIKISDSALNMIAVLGEGALRDSISILERCIQDANNELIDESMIRELVGIPKLEYISKISKAILEKDVSSAIDIIHKVFDEGKDLDNFLWEITKYVKDILVYKVSEHLDLYTETEKEFIKSIASTVEKENLLKLIYNLSKLANDMKNSTQKSIIFEIGILKECIPLTEPENVEKNISKTLVKTQNVPTTNTNQATKVLPKGKTNEIEKVVQSYQSDEVLQFWPQIIEKLKLSGKMMLYANLIGTTAIQTNDMVVEIQFPKKITTFAQKVLNEYENKEAISNLISLEMGKIMQIKFTEKTTTPVKKSSNSDEIGNIAQELEIPFNIIDE